MFFSRAAADSCPVKSMIVVAAAVRVFVVYMVAENMALDVVLCGWDKVMAEVGAGAVVLPHLGLWHTLSHPPTSLK